MTTDPAPTSDDRTAALAELQEALDDQGATIRMCGPGAPDGVSADALRAITRTLRSLS